jgi:hypothetical protein
MFRSFVIWGQQGRMEDIMDPPSQWQFELVRHRGYYFRDAEGSVSFGS